MDVQFCGYCGGRAVRDFHWVHADSGDRVTPNGPGDFVSAAHNQEGTRINPVDLVDACERCKSEPVDDEDSGLCASCVDYNAGRVVL